MKAMQYSETGWPEVLQYVEVADPVEHRLDRPGGLGVVVQQCLGSHREARNAVATLQPGDGPQGVTSFVGLDAGEPVLVHALGRDHLLAPVAALPDLERALADFDATTETRALRWGAETPGVERPYTDLAYW